MQKDDSHSIWSQPPDRLKLQSHQADVWRIRVDLPVATFKLMESNLSADESQRAARFRFPADRQRYNVAHSCLREILSRYLHCEPGELIFSANEYGKPSIQGHHLEFNLSHSGDYVLVAVSQHRKVGVDVERIRPELEFERIAGRFFSQNEVSELMSLPLERRQTAFFDCWARKEAYIKAHGLGLSLQLDSFDVSLSPHEPASLRATRPDPREAARWTLFSLNVYSGYAGAVAVNGNNIKFRCWDWNTGQASVALTNQTNKVSKVI